MTALMKAIKLSLKFSAKTTIYLATETRFIKAVVCVPISLQLRAIRQTMKHTCTQFFFWGTLFVSHKQACYMIL